MREQTYAEQLSGVTYAPLCASRSADAAWLAVAPAASMPFTGLGADVRDRHVTPIGATAVFRAVKVGPGLGRAALAVANIPAQPGSRSCRPPV